MKRTSLSALLGSLAVAASVMASDYELTVDRIVDHESTITVDEVEFQLLPDERHAVKPATTSHRVKMVSSTVVYLLAGKTQYEPAPGEWRADPSGLVVDVMILGGFGYVNGQSPRISTSNGSAHSTSSAIVAQRNVTRQSDQKKVDRFFFLKGGGRVFQGIAYKDVAEGQYVDVMASSISDPIPIPAAADAENICAFLTLVKERVEAASCPNSIHGWCGPWPANGHGD